MSTFLFDVWIPMNCSEDWQDFDNYARKNIASLAWEGQTEDAIKDSEGRTMDEAARDDSISQGRG